MRLRVQGTTALASDPVYAVVFHVVCTDISYPESLFVRLELLGDSVFVDL